MQIVSRYLHYQFEVRNTKHMIECAKRWQQSLDPELDRSEWHDSEVSLVKYTRPTLAHLANADVYRTKYSSTQHVALDGTGRIFKESIFQVDPKTASRTGTWIVSIRCYSLTR